MEYREVQRFAVLVGDEQVHEFDTKGNAEAYCAGWEGHRTYTLGVIQQALGVTP
jgi:hypothetical protein